MMNAPIRFTDYEKLSDDLLYLGQGVVLRFNVILNKKTDNGDRRNFHQEYSYNSNKYIDNPTIITVRRNFDYYISLENTSKCTSNDKEFIMITSKTIYGFINLLDSAHSWFTSKEHEGLFGIAGDDLVLLNRVEPIMLSKLSPDNKAIMVEPISIKYESGYTEGIRLYLHTKDNFTDIPYDTFCALLYTMKTFNMYMSAQLLINYHGRPTYGTNSMHMSSDAPHSRTIEGVETKGKRSLPGEVKSKSFFDKMKDLE